MKEILKKKTYLSLVWIAIVKSGVSISFGTYAPFIFKEKGFTLSQIGIIITLFFVLSGISMITSSKIEKKIRAEKHYQAVILDNFTNGIVIYVYNR